MRLLMLIYSKLKLKNFSNQGIALLVISIIFGGCLSSTKNSEKQDDREALNAGDIIPFFKHWNLILGDGSNVGDASNLIQTDFFYTASDAEGDWVVFRTPNAGNTHGTSNNTRTELAELKKWYAHTNAKLTATLKVMNVSTSGDARVAASYSTVVGQIHSADGHENEPLKIFYKKFPGHNKGSVFWHYEINTAGEDNAGRWDFSTAVWGNDFSVVGSDQNSYPTEPTEGIKLGEEFTLSTAILMFSRLPLSKLSKRLNCVCS